MCKILIMIAFAGASISVFAQNLLLNPGYEQGMQNWTSLWTRTPNAGNLQLSNTVVHSGTSAVYLDHWGPQDWSFSYGSLFPVTEGSLYELSAWARLDLLSDWAEVSVILYDSANNVMSWSWGAQQILITDSAFHLYSGRFLIPSGVAFIRPRFIGNDSCHLYLDDVSLNLISSGPAAEDFVLENDTLRLTVHSPSMALSILKMNSGRVFESESSWYFSILSVDTIQPGRLLMDVIYVPDNLPMSLEFLIKNNEVLVEIQADSAGVMNSEFNFPGRIQPQSDEFNIIPRATGMILPVQQPYPFWQFSMYGYKATMSFTGVCNDTDGYMLVSENPWDIRVAYDAVSGLHAPVLIHEDAKSVFAHNRKVHFLLVDSGYREMCSWYRNYAQLKGYIKPYSQKLQENPAMSRLKGAVDFYIGVSDLQSLAFIDSLVNFGVDKAIFSLSGGWWTPNNYAGLIDTLNAKGFLSGRYDIYTDVWPPTHPEWPWYRTEGFPDDVVVDEDGSLHEGWLSYPDGIPFQGYYTCSETHAAYANQWIPADMNTNHYNSRFIDVELASALTDCWSADHPVNRLGDAAGRYELLRTVKEDYNLVTGVEEARDWAFPVADYGEGTMTFRAVNNAGYDWATPVLNPEPEYRELNVNPAIRVPLHGLVYHDVHVPTWYTGDGASKVPQFWDDKDLLNILYASMPLFMPEDLNYWALHREKFLTSYHLVSAVGRNAGLVRMTEHHFLTPNRLVQKTVFENNWVVVVNFDSLPQTYLDKTIPFKGFYAGNGQEWAGRILDNGDSVSVVRLNDRVFLNPYGQTYAFNGLRANGTTLLKNDSASGYLSFIGNQTFVDIRPEDLPWSCGSIRVFNHDRSLEISPDTLEDGWLRIQKLPAELFYVLDFKKYTVSGHCFYDNSIQSPLDSIIVNLMNDSGQLVQSDTTANDGSFGFQDVGMGTYSLHCIPIRNWGVGSANSTDALLIMKHFVMISMLDGLKLKAADVNKDHTINSLDALLVARRFVGISLAFPAGDYVFDEVNLTVSSNLEELVMKTLCTGDVNGSWIPW